MLGFSTAAIRIRPDETRMRPSDTPLIYADNRKLCAQTGWRPTIKFEDSLKRVLEYWRADVKQKIQSTAV
jgi:GDP-4-dehydro-6-deoxy-D-mannose reductase